MSTVFTRKIGLAITYVLRTRERIRAALSLSSDDRRLYRKIKKNKLTYLSIDKFHAIMEACRSAEQSGLAGVFIETGCALGGSALMITHAKSSEREFRIYDTFETIPAPTEDDTADVHERYSRIREGKAKGIKGDQYYGYQDDLMRVVISNFAKFDFDLEAHNLHLIKGLLQDTLIVDEPVALAHIDVDWYEPVYVSLERIFPRLVTGGCIILDDYKFWGGCKKAVDEYLQTVAGDYELDLTGASVLLRKE